MARNALAITKEMRSSMFHGRSHILPPRMVKSSWRLLTVCSRISLYSSLLMQLVIEVLHLVFKNHNLSPSMRSIVGRVVISLLIALPRTPASVISDDPSLFERVNAKIQSFSVLIGAGTTSIMSKALPFIVEAGVHSEYQHVSCFRIGTIHWLTLSTDTG